MYSVSETIPDATAPDIRLLAVQADGSWRRLGRADPDVDEAAWYLVTDARAVLHPELAAVIRRCGDERPDVDIFYGDEVVAAAPGRPFEYLCKPAFDETQLASQDYMGLPIAVRRRAMAALGGLDASAGSAQGFDLLLRAIGAGIEIERITEVLAVSRGHVPRATLADRMASLRRFLAQSQPDIEVRRGLEDNSIELLRRFDDPPHVTLVIPTRQAASRKSGTSAGGVPLILGMLRSLARTDWPMDRLHVLVGDDCDDPSIFEGQSWPFAFERVRTRQPEGETFNYAAKINTLWRMARTEYVVIMNDDLLVRGAGWLRALLTFAVDENIGGVGARLLYPNETIQHAGMPGGVTGPCTHAFISMPASAPTYQNWATVQREWSMVTGAVFATRRSLLEQVDGFDERFLLDYNDVDLCLRLRLLGLRIVYTPHAELTHLESASRGGENLLADNTALFMEKWQHFYNNDPAYHPRMTRATPHVEPVPSDHDWWGRYRTPEASTS